MYVIRLVEIKQKLVMWALFVMSFYIMHFYVNQGTHVCCENVLLRLLTILWQLHQFYIKHYPL